MLLAVAYFTESIQANSVFAFLGYAGVTIFSLRRMSGGFKPGTLLLVFFASMLLIQFYTVYICIYESLFPIPTLIVYSLGILSAFSFWFCRDRLRLPVIGVSVAFVILLYSGGWRYWQNFISFGNLTGRVTSRPLPVPLVAVDESGAAVGNDSLTGKITVLDFWATTCGVCFRKFPVTQSLADVYKDDPSVSIIAVNQRLDEDRPNQAFEMIRSRQYRFNVVVVDDLAFAAKIGIKGFPTTLIVDPNLNIRFFGDIEDAEKVVEELKTEFSR